MSCGIRGKCIYFKGHQLLGQHTFGNLQICNFQSPEGSECFNPPDGLKTNKTTPVKAYMQLMEGEHLFLEVE